MVKTPGSGRTLLYQNVATAIEQSIMRGEWAPGQKLPPLADLAAHFQVSRAVVREACSVLVGSGLIELRHGDGTYVRAFSIEHFLRPMHAALLLGQADVRSLLDIAIWLERGIAQAAALRRTDAHCQQLQASLYSLETARGDAGILLEAERDFHFALADAAGNAIGANLLRVLYQALTGALHLLIREADSEGEWVTMHRSLFDSVVQMDREAAGRQLALYRTAQGERLRRLRETPLETELL